MTRPEKFYSAVFAELSPDTILVTGNQRLARTLRQAFEQKNISEGVLVWETPQIVSWSTWLQTLWDESLSANNKESRVLLSHHQEELAWQNIINRSAEANVLLQLNQVAHRAHEAWNLAHQWYLVLDSIDSSLSSLDTKTFLQWAKEYRGLCSEHYWLDSARLPDALTDHYRSGLGKPVTRILLLGFDELTPQQQRLLDVMRETGGELHELDFARPAVDIKSTRTADRNSELREAAFWCAEQWADAPGKHIAVVVPNLDQQRQRVMRIFDEVLCPDALINPDAGSRVYNISVGRPLSDHPLIDTFFLLLDFVSNMLDINKAGALITSPYISGSEEELGNRYVLDATLRTLGEATVSLETLQFYSGRQDPDGEAYAYTCPILNKMLLQWQPVSKKVGGRHHPGHWAEYFSRIANVTGWPGYEKPGSEESQCIRSWKDLLSEFSGLESIQQRFTFQESRQQLKRMAASTIFQPRTPGTPIQVMGIMEAAGLQFDSLWIAGLHDEVWPESPRPNPFLPLKEQQKIGMPHSSTARELQAASRISNRLMGSASNIVVSTARWDGDTELRPSPLFAKIPEAIAPDGSNKDKVLYTEQVFKSGARERLADNMAPALEHGFVRGGSTLFKLQAACPFRAFAELRLGAKALSEVEPGLDAMERGNLVHRLMELFWTEVKTQDALNKLNDTKLVELIVRVVSEVIDKHGRERPQTYTDRFREIETNRLQAYLKQWIAVEKERTGFSVEAVEKNYQTTVAGISVEIKIDRIDRLNDGSLAIVDYKTGVVSPASWFGDRPDEPQLPLYTVQLGEELSVVAFAQLRPGEMRYKGIARDKDLIKGVQTFHKLAKKHSLSDWAAILEYWQDRLQQLAEEYLAGRADADPKLKPNACEYCDLGSLCRISESSNMQFEDEEVNHSEG